MIFILILGSSAAGCSTNNNALTNKYCGYYFGFNGAAGSAITYNNFVCGNIIVFAWSKYECANIEQWTIGYGWH